METIRFGFVKAAPDERTAYEWAGYLASEGVPWWTGGHVYGRKVGAVFAVALSLEGASQETFNAVLQNLESKLDAYIAKSMQPPKQPIDNLVAEFVDHYKKAGGPTNLEPGEPFKAVKFTMDKLDASETILLDNFAGRNLDGILKQNNLENGVAVGLDSIRLPASGWHDQLVSFCDKAENGATGGRGESRTASRR